MLGAETQMHDNYTHIQYPKKLNFLESENGIIIASHSEGVDLQTDESEDLH